jgi:hypothetical protein
MKKAAGIIFWAVVIIVLLGTIFNINTVSKQCINYKCSEIKIPLYLKVLDFFTRDAHYKLLVKDITQGSQNEEQKVFKIFSWVNTHIQKQPPGLPIVDDHPLNIIIRGYGVEDQFEDIFTILCTYAGVESFYWGFKNKRGIIYYISFIKINGEWFPFSAFANAYALEGAKLLSVEEVMRNPGSLSSFSLNSPNFYPEGFLSEIKNMQFKAESIRVKGQNFGGRLLYHLNKILRKANK